MTKENPIIDSLDRTGLAPWEDDTEPICPECDCECDTLYFDKKGNLLGCENCITARDAWELLYDEQ